MMSDLSEEEIKMKNRGGESRPPAIGMYLLAGDEDTAIVHGSFVLARSGFSRAKTLVWEVDVPAALVPWVLIVCTYLPKVAGSFTLSVERQTVGMLPVPV